MNNSINHISNPFTIAVHSELVLESGSDQISIDSDGEFVVLKFSSLRIAVRFVKILRSSDYNNIKLKQTDQLLKIFGITICFQNRRLGILGANARPLVLSLLTAMRKIFPPAAS